MREIEIARDAYRAHDVDGVWEEAKRLAHRWRWTTWLVMPLQLRREGKAKEFKALPMTAEWFRT